MGNTGARVGKRAAYVKLHHVTEPRDVAALEGVFREEAAQACDLVHRLRRASAVSAATRSHATPARAPRTSCTRHFTQVRDCCAVAASTATA